jgi:hypothetical protein
VGYNYGVRDLEGYQNEIYHWIGCFHSKQEQVSQRNITASILAQIWLDASDITTILRYYLFIAQLDATINQLMHSLRVLCATLCAIKTFISVLPQFINSGHNPTVYIFYHLQMTDKHHWPSNKFTNLVLTLRMLMTIFSCWPLPSFIERVSKSFRLGKTQWWVKDGSAGYV